MCVCACNRPKAVIWRAGAPSTFLTILEDGVSTDPGRPSGEGLKLQGTLPGGWGRGRGGCAEMEKAVSPVRHPLRVASGFPGVRRPNYKSN